jgi:hypothetical protein
MKAIANFIQLDRRVEWRAASNVAKPAGLLHDGGRW